MSSVEYFDYKKGHMTENHCGYLTYFVLAETLSVKPV